MIQTPTSVTSGLSHTADVLKILICEVCGAGAWAFDSRSILRCQSCQKDFSITDNIVDCFHASGTSSSTTEWEAHYDRASRPYSADADWWTLSCWREHLFGIVLDNLAGKLVVDFGCGTASRIASIAPIQEHGYHYVGVDSSLEALKCAARNVPGATFVRASLRSLRLRPEIADVVLCLGILMYFEKSGELLERFVDALKPGGLLLLHEQISRKSWSGLARYFLSSPQSVLPAAYGVRHDELCDRLARCGTIVHTHTAGSPLRKLLIMGQQASRLVQFRSLAASCDSLWCSTVGRVFPQLGPAEVQLVFRKA